LHESSIRKTGLDPRLSVLLKIAAGAASLYLAACLNMFFDQDRLIFPGAVTQGWPKEVVAPSSDFDLVHLQTADGDPFVAIFGVALDRAGHRLANANSQATILFFNGNGMCVADSFQIFRELRRLGANVMIVEYPGYGMSGGKASEKSFYAAADAAYHHLTQQPDVDPRQIVAAGWSIGAAVAIDLAARKPVAGLATFSAFTRMRDVLSRRTHLLPMSLLLRSHFDNLATIGRIGCPIFIAHGTHDSAVPFAMSKKLIAAANRPVTSVQLNSDHDVFQSGNATLDEQLKQFLSHLKSN
jgi:uncharacterized protein